MSRTGSPPTWVSDLTPTEGARFLLERLGEDELRARYRATIYTPTATHAGHAVLGEDGSVEVSLEAPEPLVAMLGMFGKLVARAAAGNRAKGIAPWPARVMRWRGPGRGA
ncbi:hypothetical protein BH11MYX1_BH11MYX1_26270 [soil metagenome]